MSVQSAGMRFRHHGGGRCSRGNADTQAGMLVPQSWVRMNPIPRDQQQALIDRLMAACGGSYSPERRRKYYITGPQWAAAYEGQALFHAPTRKPVVYEEVIRQYARIVIGYWTTHDTDVIPTHALGRDEHAHIVERIKGALHADGVACSMVTTE